MGANYLGDSLGEDTGAEVSGAGGAFSCDVGTLVEVGCHDGIALGE